MSVKLYSILTLILLSTFVFYPASIFAQDKIKEVTNSQQSEVPQQKLVRVSTLSSVEANQEFQRNIQILRSQRQRAMELQYQLEMAKTDKLKTSIQEELDLSLDNLKESNLKMTKYYGFSLTRNYVIVVEKAHIYMQISDDELAEINKEKDKKVVKKD